jgi:predicted sugar kinase
MVKLLLSLLAAVGIVTGIAMLSDKGIQSGQCYELIPQLVVEVVDVNEESMLFRVRHFDENDLNQTILVIMSAMMGNRIEASLEEAKQEFTKENRVNCSDFKEMLEGL